MFARRPMPIAKAALMILWYALECTLFSTGQDCSKNPRLPICRFGSGSGSGSGVGSKACDPYYIIPGNSNQCGKQVGGRYLSIDPSTVAVKGDDSSGDGGLIKIPGCFTIQFNVEIFDSAKLDQSFFAKINFDWLSLREFSDLPCKNQSSNGCGGYGNNCYYCDICNSLQQLHSSRDSASNIREQFSDVNCPNKPGIYMLKKRFCFNDLNELDKNNNCEMDALESNEGQQYKKALQNLQQSGFGTVIATFSLATNATSEQKAALQVKNSQIESSALQELQTSGDANKWAARGDELSNFKDWFVQSRRDAYYKTDFLPMLLSSNEVGCLSVSFVVCDKKPVSVDGKLTCPMKINSS